MEVVIRFQEERGIVNNTRLEGGSCTGKKAAERLSRGEFKPPSYVLEASSRCAPRQIFDRISCSTARPRRPLESGMNFPISLRGARCAASSVLTGLVLALSLCDAVHAQSVPLEDPGFTEALIEQFRTALPDEHVVLVAPQRLTIGNTGSSVNLARLWQFCHATPERCDAQSVVFVSGMTKSFKEMNKPPERAQVRIALRSAATAKGLLAGSRGTGLNLQVQPFVGGIVSVVVIDSPTSLRWASSHDLEALKLDPEGLRELARANTHAGMQPLVSIAPPAPRGEVGAIDGADAYTASRLLFPSDWAPLAKAQSGVLIVAVPRPGTILYIGDDSAGAVAALRDFAHQRLAGAADGLGDELLRWTPEGWKLVN
jgi:hypothetical protein